MGDISRILVTGACGQIGSELIPALRGIYGAENVVASDVRAPKELQGWAPFEILDVTEDYRLRFLVKEYQIDTIVHLAALLSATGEQRPQLAWKINIEGFRNVLEVAREAGLKRVFHPSSIAAFGPSTPRDNTPQDTILKPTTMYGVTKVTGELLGDYYFKKYGVDVRGIRFPGVISNVAPPGGGTTDYAVEIFYEAIKKGSYTCFLREDSALPMIYMPDVIKSVTMLLEADVSRLKHHTDFNLSAFSFTPREIADEIRKHIPGFKMSYQPDFRQAIADSWPRSIDDSVAREEWDWKPDYSFSAMVEDMLKVLGRRHALGQL